MVEHNNTDKYMFSIIMITILVIGVIVVALFVIKPFYSTAVSVTSKVNTKQTELNKLEAQEAKLKQLQSQEAELDQDATTVSNALPTSSDVGRLFIQLNDLANNSGGSVQSVTNNASASSTAGATSSTTLGSVPGVTETTYIMPIDFGSYFNFKNFINSSESALRLVGVDDVTVNANDSGTIDASLTLTTYTRGK